MRDLPLYNEQAPNDEVVLLKQIRTLDGTDDHGGNENGNAPSAEVVPPYADSGSAPKVPQVTTTTAGSPRHSMDAAKSVQDLSRNSGSNATTTNPSTNSVEPQNAHVDNGPTPGAAVGPHAPPHGDLPT
ncbi:unnamed protein product [Rhizoctonia solani]|nr:unnamed protein product [Rhizoctonia solani]